MNKCDKMPKVLCDGHYNTCRETQAECLIRLLFDRKTDVHLQVYSTGLVGNHKQYEVSYFALGARLTLALLG